MKHVSKRVSIKENYQHYATRTAVGVGTIKFANLSDIQSMALMSAYNMILSGVNENIKK